MRYPTILQLCLKTKIIFIQKNKCGEKLMFTLKVIYNEVTSYNLVIRLLVI